MIRNASNQNKDTHQPNEMPQKFMSKFAKLNLQGKLSRRYVKKPETESDSSDSEDIDLYSSAMLSLVTRNGPILLKRQAVFDEIFEKGMPANINHFECITACGNTRNTVLYPCRHMHLCKECWYLLKTYESEKMKKAALENSSDDKATMPRCPYCREGVESSDEVYI